MNRHKCGAVTLIVHAEWPQSATGTEDRARWCVLLTELTFLLETHNNEYELARQKKPTLRVEEVGVE